MTEGKLITDPADMQRFAMAGNCTFTLVSKATSTRYTFKVQAPKKECTKNNTDFSVLFVSLLMGADNTKDYGYIGFIKPRRALAFIHGTRKGRAGISAPSVKALAWFINQLANGGSQLTNVEFWHRGYCAACSRELTVPESIDCGFGPSCAAVWGVNRRAHKQPNPAKLPARAERAQDVRAKTKTAKQVPQQSANGQMPLADVRGRFCA